MSTDPLTYVLSCLRRAADNAYPWSLTPTEAGALAAEVALLREGEARRLQLLDDAGGWENERNALRGQVERLHGEVDGCVATIESLRAGRDHYRRAMEYADAEAERLREENRKLRDVLEWVNTQCPGKCSGVCDAALRGEHRREEEK